MSGKLWIALLAALLLAVAWLGAGATQPVSVAYAAPAPAQLAVNAAPVAPPEAAPEQATPNGAYLWNYSVKFVCGKQAAIDAPGTNALGEPPVKPGNYATEINIHNYNYREALLRKKLLVMVEKGEVIAREPDVARPNPNRLTSVVLGPDWATLDDCNAIWKLAGGVPPATNPPLTIGYLVILSPVDLDIDAVYTAESYVTSAAGTPDQSAGVSIDVERVPGKRVFVPTNVIAQWP